MDGLQILARFFGQKAIKTINPILFFFRNTTSLNQDIWVMAG